MSDTPPPSYSPTTHSPTPGEEAVIEQVTVDTVIDGDTIRANVDGRNERIRLLSIAAPEIGRDGTADEKCAQEAKRFLDGWIGATTVTVTTDQNSPQRDQYDRLLAYVDVNDVDVSYVMLDDGWADLYTGNKDLTRWNNYQDAVQDRTQPRCAAAQANTNR